MAYRNKTYVCFEAGSDIKMYHMMCAWRENKKIDFDFYDAHDLNNLRKDASEKQIKTKLRERLKNTRALVVLVGEKTKTHYKYVRWEIEVAIELDIPIIAANLDKKNGTTKLTPPILKNNALYVSVPFGIKPIKRALTSFPDEYKKLKKEHGEDYTGWRYYSSFDNFDKDAA